MKSKRETDLLIANAYEILSKDLKSENEKKALINLLLPKQQQANEKLINDQSKMIEKLTFNCKMLQNELKKANESNNGKQTRKSLERGQGFQTRLY